jgi:hypothetical protein
MPAVYTFPEKNPFYAREVLDTDFDIKDYPSLYVNMDQSRLNEREVVGDFRENLKFCLNIDPDSNKLLTPPNDYKKILFVGHRGTGKTQELRRLHRELDHPDRYFSILIEIEQELEVARLKPEDLFALMVLKIIREMNRRGLDNYTQVFDGLVEDWLRDREVVEEIADKNGWKVEGGVGINDKNLLAQLVSFLKLEFNAKAEFAKESKTSTVIRETIAKNFLTFVSKFNEALQQVRREVQARKKGQDILLIIDGTEKAPAEFYENLFQKNGHIFRDIGANIITTAPIDAFYRLRDRNNLDFFDRVHLPMIYLDTEAKRQALRQIVAERVAAEVFFEPAALDQLIEMSGGCLRQLLRLGNQVILNTRGKKADLAAVNKTVRLEGRRMYEQLNARQIDILRQKSWGNNWADPDQSEMLFALVLLKYNGHAQMNPILREIMANE